MRAQKKPRTNLALKLAIVASGHTSRRIAQRARIGEVRLSALVRGRLAATDAEKRTLARLLGHAPDVLFSATDEVA